MLPIKSFIVEAKNLITCFDPAFSFALLLRFQGVERFEAEGGRPLGAVGEHGQQRRRRKVHAPTVFEVAFCLKFRQVRQRHCRRTFFVRQGHGRTFSVYLVYCRTIFF